MGGADCMDQNIAAYCIIIRFKKMWWAIFAWEIDTLLQNAVSLLQKYGIPRSRSGPCVTPTNSRASLQIRFDSCEYFPET